MTNGKLIALEGIDGAGKTTQGALLAEHLQAKGYDAVLTREPGDTPLGKEIRRMLETRYLTNTERLFLFLTDRASHMERVVLPALKRGAIVITDRFTLSTIAYQTTKAPDSYIHEDVHASIPWLNDIASANCSPDLTIFYDLVPRMGRDSADYVGVFGPELVRQKYLEDLEDDALHTAVIPARAGDELKIARLTVEVVRDKLRLNI